MKNEHLPTLDRSALLAALRASSSTAPPSGDIQEATDRWVEALTRRDAAQRRLRDLEKAFAAAEAAAQAEPPPAAPAADAPAPQPPWLPLPHEQLPAVGPPSMVEGTALNRLHQIPELGATVPDFHYRSWWSRGLARLTARLVLFLTRFLTVDQREHNRNVQAFCQQAGERLNDLYRSVAESQAMTHLVQENTLHLRQIQAQMQADLQAGLEHVKAGLRQEFAHRLQEVQATLLSEADLLRLQETLAHQECELAWQTLFNLELAEHLARMEKGERVRPLSAWPKDRLDYFYGEFEDRFRGPRELILDRLKYYLPMVRNAEAVNSDSLILDLGCGRGEWLELLAEHGMNGRGVDNNSKFVEDCRAQGIEVDEADVLAYLRALPAETAAMVTSFHLVEHLPLVAKLELIDEIFRVLKPGGRVILETPNPENLDVGSFHFYADPTHEQPIPPFVLVFMLEHAGFEELGLHRLKRSQEMGEIEVGEDDTAGQPLRTIAEALNTRFAVGADYAVVGCKPGHPGS